MNKYIKSAGKFASIAALTTALYVGNAGCSTSDNTYDSGQSVSQESDMDKALDYIIPIGVGLVGIIGLASSFRIVRPNERGLIERWGKYNRFATPGLNFVLPLGIEKMYSVNITEQMVDAEPQEIITSDKLNAIVDAQVYFKVKDTENDVKNTQYNVNNYALQIVSLARTTLRNIIGGLTLNQANGERNRINSELRTILKTETNDWGIDIVRTELKQIDPPKDVQETMNRVVKAENEKIAAIDYATAKETEADGDRRVAVKKAEGSKQSAILEAEGIALAKQKVAEGEAKAIQIVNEAADKYFTGNAQLYKRLEVTQSSLQNNAKIVVPANTDITALFYDGKDMPIVAPLKKKDE